LVNRKRFVTQELKALERDLLRAQTEIESVEDAVFNKVKNEVTFYLGHLRQLAQSLAYLDALFSLAKMAYEHNYVLPHFNDDREIIINGGRHPIVEQKLNETFIKNDTRLTNQKSIWIITGPNMGGKSTYLRQVALICIMAQCGSFVPSESASLSILDRVFTRIGSGDNLAEGKSTFLVEMEETATICTAATNRSLVILDEVGRGTSTYDGMALAQAIIEYIVEKVGAKCLFATHYHELTRVSQRYAVVANYHLESRNTSNGVVFLHSVAEGVAGGSFGLEVAKLANLPLSIIQRASELLMEIDPNSKKNLSSTWHSAHSNQLLNNSEVYKEQLRIAQSRLASLEREVLVDKSINQILSQINLDTLSPKQAFDLVWEIKNLIS
jgi:DNA mismatch repair protein MutS